MRACTLVAGVVNLALGVGDFLLQAGDLAFEKADLRVRAFVGAGEVAVVAERGDADEDDHRGGHVQLQRTREEMPVPIQERSGDELADFETGRHDHDGRSGTDEQHAQSPDGEERRTSGNEQGRCAYKVLKPRGYGNGVFHPKGVPTLTHTNLLVGADL
jgi:hypothetical protein